MTGSKSIVFKFADVEVREREFRLVRAGEVLPVEPKTFRVLLYLLRNPQKLIAKDELLNAVWGDAIVTDSSLTRTIAQLRRLLGDEIRDPRYIETVATVGYRFLCKVEVCNELSGTLETSGKVNGLGEKDFVGTLANGQIPDVAVSPRAEVHTTAERGKGPNGKQIDGRRYTLLWWLLPGVAIFVIVLAVTTWYLRRPLPPLRVTGEYVQITHDGHQKSLVGTDGSRLYFTQDSGMGPIAQVAISGGEIAPVAIALPVFSLEDVSPDGSSLLVTTFDGGHWGLSSVPIPAGPPRQLLTGVSVNSAAWAPDGKSVVYSTGNSDLYVIQSDGTGLRKLADVGGPTNTLSWSPDGSRIRFFKDSRLWEIASDGSGLHALLQDWLPSTPLCCGRWTTDGKFFVFPLQNPFRGGYEPGNQLWTLDERRRLFRRTPAEPVQLTSGPIRWTTPVPSKDGTKIFAQGVILRGELVRFDGRSKQLQAWLGGISAEYVTFSPDGQFVAYVTFPEGVMWRAHRDGSNRVQLTNPPLYPKAPHWSPDGAQILFSEAHSQSYIVSSQGGTPRLIAPEEKGGTGDGSWSPDGRKIVFCSFKTMEEIGSLNYDLRILDLGSRQITTLPGSHGTFSPRWSPNGRYITGLHIGAPGGLKVFDLEKQREFVLPEKSEVDWPTWSSNSQFIYFYRPGEQPGLYRVRVSNGVEERVVDLTGFRSTGAFHFWFGLDPQDTPLLIRDVGTADIYALTLETK